MTLDGPVTTKLRSCLGFVDSDEVGQATPTGHGASGVKRFIAFRPPLRHASVPPPWGLNWRRPMIAFLIGVGALILAVIACAIVDPRPSREDADDLTPTIDSAALSL